MDLSSDKAYRMAYYAHGENFKAGVSEKQLR